ncbi:hypothetical protein Ocin01_17049 [Orchesella cincta]|uniref:Protein giant-lens n=1 Tax=Orchesella cincta TaxID=48709 RepID=A0A1D2M9R7_ORCCI|nr:hypothetical protein Ocin01_17049 [Orchesella cincta]
MGLGESYGERVLRVSQVSAIIFLCQVSCIIHAQRDSATTKTSPSNYKDAVFVYPTGIRSERDLPVCPSFIEEENKDMSTGSSSGLSNPLYIGSDMNKLQQPGSTRNPADSKKTEYPSKYLSACNIIHRRYFYPPIVERLCRCPDRTECPMEWSQPPKYKDLFVDTKGAKSSVSTTPSTKSATTMDPYTVMVSSRSQLKFCTEVATNLPDCEGTSKHNKEHIDDIVSMVKTVRKTFIAPELPIVTVNCFCPPLYRRWKFMSKNETTERGNNGTAETNYNYRCDKMRRCKTDQQCGTVRTDLHFSYYHCSCPKEHLCVPKVYPPVSTSHVVDHAEEALFSGQVAPAFCTPERVAET